MTHIKSQVLTPAAHRGRFDDLIFTPLDLPAPPAVDAESFIEWMRSDNRTGMFQKERYERLTGCKYPWLLRAVTSDLTPLQAAYPQVLEYARLYPFKTVKTVIFLAQDGYQPIFPHADSDGLVGMRFYLKNRHVEGLHFYKGLEPYDSFNSAQFDADGNPTPVHFKKYFKMDEAIYARFPQDSRSFMLNSARAIHGIDANTCKLGDRIAVLVQGELDVKRFETMVESSLSRYGDYAIWY